MIDVIYVEQDVCDHPRVHALLDRFPKAEVVECERYGEIFNRRSQNFRLQKKKPALIAARKWDGFVLQTPPDFGIGAERNYYFSHMLNCVYDCRYCFLQGMYASAHYIWFVNYEDFWPELERCAEGDGRSTFFSGYDCDSLALDGVTQFLSEFLPRFESLPDAELELRTKSVVTRPLLSREAMPNVVVAYSLTPGGVAQQIEHGAPKVEARLDAARRLAERGWGIGFRFDPLIYHDGWREAYSELIAQAFHAVPPEGVHSVTLGPLRFPKAMYRKIRDLYPEEPLLAGGLASRNAQVSYGTEIEQEMEEYVRGLLTERLPEQRIFSCVSDVPAAGESGCSA